MLEASIEEEQLQLEAHLVRKPKGDLQTKLSLIPALKIRKY